MNKQPVSYLQTDARWSNKIYIGKSTIGKAGCGPTAAAMLIETITGKTYTPETACKWSADHGHAVEGHGTAYAYFKPQFEAMGIKCDMLNWYNSYGKPDHANHEKAFNMLKEGCYLIALMGKGLWTSGGHFVVVWWQDDKVFINDPASTKIARLEGDLNTFKSQVKYYWWVDARDFNNERVQESQPVQEVGEWAKEMWTRAKELGLCDGTRPRDPCTRQEAVVIAMRLYDMLK